MTTFVVITDSTSPEGFRELRPPTLALPVLTEGELPPARCGRPATFRKLLDISGMVSFFDSRDAALVPLHDKVLTKLQEELDLLAGNACPDDNGNRRLVRMVNRRAEKYGAALLFHDSVGDLREVRVKWTSGVFELRTPGRDFELLLSSAAWPPLLAGRRQRER